jgi:hypothetical protein
LRSRILRLERGKPRPRKPASLFRYFNSSPEVIRLVVLVYVRFPLALRNVNALLFERGIDISMRQCACGGTGMGQFSPPTHPPPAGQPNARLSPMEVTLIRGGQNIYPPDIEEVLFGLEGVAEAAVIGTDDPVLGEVPVAYVALSPTGKVSAAALLARCNEELALYKQPAAIHFLTELPNGPTGKILCRELRRQALDAAQGAQMAAA